MENLVYQNKYGRLELQPGEYQNVSDIHSKDLDEDVFFGIDEAEKIALITENKNIQLAFAYPELKKAFVLHHKSFDAAAVCRVVSLEFTGGVNPQEEIERLRPKGPRF